MPATVIVNNLTVVHKASGGSSVAAPDVCKTPTPGGPVPVPYVNVTLSRHTVKGSKKVRVDGYSIMHKSSQFSTSSGDEPGTLGGVVSGKTRGKAYPRSYSFDVKVEGQPVFRFTDMMIQNSGSPANAAGIESQTNDLAAPIDVDKAELIEMRWSKNKLCCGDPVTLAVKTRNADDGQKIYVGVDRTDLPEPARSDLGRRMPMDLLPVAVHGDSGEARWVSRWRYRYNQKVPAVAIQGTLKGPRDSVNALEFQNPPDRNRHVFGKCTGSVFKPAPNGSTLVYQGEVTWVYEYDIEVTRGHVYVRRQLDFVRAPGEPSLLPVQWRAWKREIESVWDNQFYFHRLQCERGQICDCGVNGCCKYPLRILAVQGTGHGTVRLFLGGPKAENQGKPDLWWNAQTWWTALGDAGPYVRAHEFGHLIGCFDEYPKGVCERSRIHRNVPGSVMNAGKDVYPRHVEGIRDKFEAKAGVGPVEIMSM